MSLGTEWNCPVTEDICFRNCPQTACRRDLDEASWPDVEPDPMDLGETIPWPMESKSDASNLNSADSNPSRCENDGSVPWPMDAA